MVMNLIRFHACFKSCWKRAGVDKVRGKRMRFVLHQREDCKVMSQL